jgi:Flp pilus assembly protein TadG
VTCHRTSAPASRRRQQSGAAAVEFALVFPLLFMMIYGMVVYAYLFVLQQSLVFAAQEAAEAVVQVDPRTGSDIQRTQAAQLMAARVLAWLPQSQKARVLGDDTGSAVSVTTCDEGQSFPCPGDTSGVIVRLTFNLATPNYLFPVINLVGVGAVPPMPAALTASAVARI